VKTEGVKRLVEEVMESLPQPYTEDVIDEVFHAVERKPAWRTAYDELCDSLGTTTVNTWGGWWIAAALGKVSVREVAARKSTLIKNYSILVPDDRSKSRKPTEAEALKLLSDYYLAYKAALPKDIREHREHILEWLREGAPVEEAFRRALERA
jgi:hypothetical protein